MFSLQMICTWPWAKKDWRSFDLDTTRDCTPSVDTSQHLLKVRVKNFRNSIKRFNQITTLYLKKRVISNRNLISENIYVLEGLLNVSLTAHTSSAYLITNSNIWLFCLSFRYLSLPCLFPIVDFFQKWWFLLEMKRSNACTIPGCYTWYSVKCCFDTNDNWMRAGCKYLCAWESFQYLE